MANLTSIARIPQTIRNLQRMREILAVVTKYGFEGVVLRLGIEGWVDQARRFLRLKLTPSSEMNRYSVEERIRMVIEELGPTYIKFGQILATRPDLIPMSLILELRKLQDDVPAFPWPEAKRTVEAELGGPIEEHFSRFEEKPLAAASIAQVHRATLKSGEEVVVKVQRPGLDRTISTDLDILRILADLLAENVPEAAQFDPRGLVREFAISIVKEIDFTREAFHLLKFAENFADVDHVHVPRVYSEQSTSKILTMEFIDGIKASDYDALDAGGYDRELLASRGTEAVLKQIFVDGFFHADPHPGNLFVLPGNVVCFIDCGMMGFVDDERIDELLVFLIGILTADLDRLVNLFYRLDIIDESVNVRAFKGEGKAMLDRYSNMPLKDLDIAVFITEVFDLVQRHNVQLPADLLLMAKAVATMEGIAQELYPEYDPLGEMRQFLLRTYTKRLTDPTYLLKGAYHTFDHYAYLIRRFPRDAEVILSKLRTGELTVRTEEVGRREDAGRQERATNRLAVAGVTLALGLSSTALLIHPVGPTVSGMAASTLVGGLGYLTSLGLGTLIALGAFRASLR